MQATGIADLDLTWAHDFHLAHTAEADTRIVHFGVSAFEVLNDANFGGFVGTVKSPLYQQPTTAHGGQRDQLNLEDEF